MAEITDLFGRPSAENNYAQATTVKTARTPGESVLAGFDLSAFSTTEPVFFLTYKKVTDPTTNEITIINQASWKALVNPDNNTLTNLTLAPGYVDVGNDVGDYIEPIPTSFWGNSLISALLRSHNPDGSVKVGQGEAPGVVKQYAGAVAPTGYLLCDGASYLREDYPGLFAVIGTTYGSADGTHFNVPDMKGRVAVGMDAAQTEFNTLGKTGGDKRLQSHTHNPDSGSNYGFMSYRGGGSTGRYLYQPHSSGTQRYTFGSTTLNDLNYSDSTASAGSGNSQNLQPYTALNHIIKI